MKSQWECNDHCEWSGDSCSMSCDAKYGDDEDECSADSSCFWVEAWDQCKDTCDGREDWQCHDHCTWSGDSCTTSCNTAADEDSCTGDCNWKDDSCQGCNSDECGGCDDGDACEGCGTHEYESGWVTYGSWYDHGDGTSGDCHMNWYWKDYDEDEEDDGGSSLGSVISGVVGGIFATALSIAFASSVNSMREICAIGPTIGMGFNDEGTYYIGPQLCTIDGTHYKSKHIVHGNSAKGACRKYCTEAALKFSSVELFTCYCSK